MQIDFSFFLQIFDFNLTKEETAVVESCDRNWRACPFTIDIKKMVRLFIFQ